MRSMKSALWLLCGLVSAAGCSSAGIDESRESAGTQGDGIIRATSNGGRDQVVMLYGVTGDGGRTYCTGSYYAPRVVVTAAHCLQNLYQLFVYYGDDLEQDLSQLTSDGFIGLVPPPLNSPTSKWAQADSWQSHPAYDPVANAADLGAVFLDRKPPFDPLPLYRSRVSSGLNVTITGWGSNSTPTPTTGEGYGVQRSGSTLTMGNPTAADYHSDDPNPGMLDPAVRQTVLKTNGASPRANGCFGDSGGPILLNQYGQTYIAGVGYWTGLSCEDYNLWMRIDAFLPFLDLSYKRGGQDVLKPTLACVRPNPQGSLTAIFGYQNDNGVAISVPYGPKNASARDTSGLRPTRFEPGLHPFAFGVDFTPGQTASWTFAPDNNPSLTVNATASSPTCTAAQSVDSGCVLQCRAQLRSGCARAEESDQCVEFCAEIGHVIEDFVPECNDERVTWQSCVNAVAPGSSNWDCNFEDFIGIYGEGPQPPACQAKQDAYTNCLLGG